MHHTGETSPAWQKLGIALTFLSVLFLAMDAAFKIAGAAEAVAATGNLGFPATSTPTLGFLLAGITVLYAVPRTSVLGAVVLTGYLGGAVAVHWQHGSPIGTHVLFGVYVGIVAWLGLWLRSSALRALLPVRMAVTAAASPRP